MMLEFLNSLKMKAGLPNQIDPELTAADVIISGGRGMQNGENFEFT